MSGECEKCGEHALECSCHLLLDPETIHGDYAESYQRWHHYFNKSSESIEECFKDTAFVPFEPIFDPGIQTPKWNALSESLKKMQKQMNNLELHLDTEKKE